MKKEVGIIIDNIIVSKQLYDLIRTSVSSNNYKVTTLIINETNADHRTLTKVKNYIKNRGLSKFLSTVLFTIISKTEALFIRRNQKLKKFYNKYDLSEFKLKIISVTPKISKNGYVYRYQLDDLKKIKSQNLNLLIRGGSGILKGDILKICPNGVLSFHHADNQINRGGPPCFWEVFYKEPRTGFVIQRLKEELDGGDVLYRGFVSTSWMYSLNLIKLYEISNQFFNLVIDDITSTSSKLKVEDKTPYSHRLYSTPSIIIQLIYLIRTTSIILNKLVLKVSMRRYRWSVAYQFTENWKDVTLWRSKTIPNPKNRFLADPFIIKKSGKYFCFVEDYNYLKSKGCISVYEIDKNGSYDRGVAISEDFHLSYPYLFEYEGNLYMCPESHEKRDIRIYKCLDFPLKWQLEKVIMNNVNAADTNIFFKDNKWWLITNISTSYIDDHESQLYAFYSTNPLSDNWSSHKKNPIVFDSLRARNGGLIQSGSDIYRVYQKQGFDKYGEALGVAKIMVLSPDEYTEDSLFEIEANFFKGIRGTHTYNYNKGLLVFDFSKNSNIKSGT